jgi:hypothetical protein
VDIPLKNKEKIDINSDDTIGMALRFSETASHVSNEIPLAIHAIARPLDANDKIPRNDIISLKNSKPNDTWKKIKKVLGWIIKTRLLSISLLPNNYSEWARDL